MVFTKTMKVLSYIVASIIYSICGGFVHVPDFIAGV